MKGLSVKPDPSGTNSKIPNEAWQYEIHVEWKAIRRLSLSLDRGHEGRIREVLQEDGCSSCVQATILHSCLYNTAQFL
jgi:hypothetical protein